MRITENYYKKQADVLHSKYKTSCIKGHGPDTGTNRERIFSQWIGKHLPKTVKPYLGGKIIDAFDNESRQVDVIVYNNSYPRFGANPKRYYFSEGVVVAVEVKSLLNSSQLDDALMKIDSIKKCQLEYIRVPLSESPKNIYAGIFAFEMKYKSGKSLIDAINRKLEDSGRFIPDFICVNKKTQIVFNYGTWQKTDKRRKEPKVKLPEGYIEVANNKLSIMRMALDISQRAIKPVALLTDFQRYYLDKEDWIIPK